MRNLSPVEVANKKKLACLGKEIRGTLNHQIQSRIALCDALVYANENETAIIIGQIATIDAQTKDLEATFICALEEYKHVRDNY